MLWLLFCRNIISSVNVRTLREAEEKRRVLAENAAAATVEEIKHKFEEDMKALRARASSLNATAQEAALDARYLSQRQSPLT